MSELADLDVVILAGGMGTRLQSALPDRPKFLAPVLGRPFADYLFRQLSDAEVRRVVLALGHRSDEIARYLETRPGNGLKIEVSVESEPLGTGGALRFASSRLRSESALVMNGDSFVAADIPSFLTFHDGKKAAASIVGAEVPESGRFGGLEIDDRGAVTRFLEKGARGAGTINAGIYLIRRKVIDAIPAGRAVSLERDTFPSLCGRGLFAFCGEFAFIDIGTPESLVRADRFFSEGWERP